MPDTNLALCPYCELGVVDLERHLAERHPNGRELENPPSARGFYWPATSYDILKWLVRIIVWGVMAGVALAFIWGVLVVAGSF